MLLESGVRPIERLPQKDTYGVSQSCLRGYYRLFCLAMQGMFSAAIAELLEFDPVRIISTIFLSGVITLLAYCASQVDHHTNIFLWHMQSNPFGSIGASHRLPL